MRPDRAEGLTDLYEETRSFALGERQCVAAPMGLALIMRHGMAAWLQAWSKCSASPRLEPERIPGDRVGPEACHSLEVAVVLANMALAGIKGVVLR